MHNSQASLLHIIRLLYAVHKYVPLECISFLNFKKSLFKWVEMHEQSHMVWVVEALFKNKPFDVGAVLKRNIWFVSCNVAMLCAASGRWKEYRMIYDADKNGRARYGIFMLKARIIQKRWRMYAKRKFALNLLRVCDVSLAKIIFHNLESRNYFSRI